MGSLYFYCEVKPKDRSFIRKLYNWWIFPHITMSMWSQGWRRTSAIGQYPIRHPILEVNPCCSTEIDFYMNATLAEDLGWGCVFGSDLMYGQWLPCLLIDDNQVNVQSAWCWYACWSWSRSGKTSNKMPSVCLLPQMCWLMLCLAYRFHVETIPCHSWQN